MQMLGRKIGNIRLNKLYIASLEDDLYYLVREDRDNYYVVDGSQRERLRDGEDVDFRVIFECRKDNNDDDIIGELIERFLEGKGCLI